MKQKILEIEDTEVFRWPWTQLQLEEWLCDVANMHNKSLGKLKVCIVLDQDLLKKNVEFLDHDTLTDIITFDYSSRFRLKGELWISIDRVLENATNLKLSLEEELLRVVVHGLLHLCGQEDKTEMESKEMREKENEALVNWNKRAVPRGTLI